MNQRGFAIPSLTQLALILVVATAAIGSFWGLVAWHAHVNYARGQADKQVEWDKKKAEDAAAGARRDAAVRAALLDQQKRADEADARADQADQQWEAERRENARNRRPLAACPVGRSAAADGAVQPAGEPVAVTGSGLRAPASLGAGPAADPGSDPGVRLLWRFVWMHDGAFTGIDGQPLFRDPARAGPDDPRADTASPYTLDDALDVAGANARALSACRRTYLGAIVKLERAAAAWGQR